jgi:drug/metabolite transporter (DMT)-like permease
MIYLILSVLSSVFIYLTFKISEKFKTNLLKLIIINYLVAASLGFYFNKYPISFTEVVTSTWVRIAAIIGIAYILMFFLIGYSIRKSGIAVTTIASKLSMLIPILYSMLYFGEKNTGLKITGLVMVIIAVLFTCYRPIDKAKNIIIIALPVIIFIGSGMTDALVKYAQSTYVPNQMSLLFPAVVFLMALLSGMIFSLFSPKVSLKNTTFSEIIGGTILGTANFGSLYFLILALNNSKIDSSIVFGLNNLCIVLFSLLFGLILFHEKFLKINFAGLIIALAAILILMKF